MSNYGPPDRPYLGGPQEPFSARGRHDPYGQPGEPDPAAAHPRPDEAHPAHRPGRPAPILVLVAVLAVLLVGGGAVALQLLGHDEAPTARASAQPSDAVPSGVTGPSGARTSSAPAAQSSTDARFVKVGQCVRNEGGAGQPRLVVTKCGAKSYQVLARFDGATTGERDAKAKCGKVRGYTDWYFFNSELDALDFVLCLKLR